MTPPTEWLTLDQAAARLGCSSRTLQRRIANGEMPSQRRDDGRTLVEVEALTACPTAVMPPEVVERLQRQADDTNRVAALAALASEQTAVAYRDRLATVESALSDARSTARTWRMLAMAAASVTVSAVVVASFLAGDRAATGRQVSDMGSRLVEAEDARRGLQAALQAMTEARQVSDAEADRLRDQVVELQALVGVDPVDRPTVVAAD
ncbi:MAG: helix-turn-helix domain-containing protein [Planctomyces sp.]|jgi:excisionase family DNA binding protein